jgi:hypothetical protein
MDVKHKEGYDFLAANFGKWQLCRTLEEAKEVAANMTPDKGMVYSWGFYSEKFKKCIGRDRWFPVW